MRLAHPFTPPAWHDGDLDAWRANVERFVSREVLPRQAAWRRQGHADRDCWRLAGEHGLLLADVPEQHGGGGGHFGHMAVLWEALGRAGDCAFGTQVHAVVAHYLLRHGSAAQKARHLPTLASGECIAAIAISEPGAGSDLQALRTSATRQPDGGLVLAGGKRFVSNGHLADLVLVAAQVREADGRSRLSLVLLDTRQAPGFRRGPIAEMLGRRGQDVCDLFFDEVALPPDAVLGLASGRGLSQLMGELPYERLAIAVSALAAVDRALELGLAHARTRRAFGKPLFELQAVRFTLARAKAQAVAARCFVEACIGESVAGRVTAGLAAMAKWQLTELQGRVVDECLQLFGGDGYMADHPIAQLYADARVQRIYGGASEIMLEVIAHAL